MNSYLKQSTASQSRAIGPFVDDTDFKTPETALTIANTDIKLVVNGAASANKNSGGGTHRVNGIYGVTFDATDTATVGEMDVSIVVSGALPVFHKFVVLEEAVYDALFGASAVGYVTDQPVNATKIGGTTQTGRDLGASVLLSSGTGTGQLDFTSGVVKANVTQFGGTNATTSGGRPEVNTTHVAGTSQTAKDLGAINVTNLNTLSSHDPGETIMGATDLGTGSGFTSLASATNLAAVKTVVDAVQVVTDELADTLEDQGGGVYGFTTAALQEAPGGGGGGTTDWDATERAQIRYRLGIDGTASAPVTNSEHLSVTATTVSDKTGYALTSAYDAAKTAASQTSVDDLPTNTELSSALSGLSTFDATTDEVIVGNYASGKAPLQPTTAGRTLDVTATGAAGIDWGNVENASTTVNLSGTSVKTATDVEADTQDLQSKIGTPSDLGSGASVAKNLVDIESQTDDIGVAGAGLTSLPAVVLTSAYDAAKTAAQPGDPMALVEGALDALAVADDGSAEIGTAAAAAVQTSAATTPLPSNVKKINNVTVTGNGTSGTPWGP